jgi:pimeloyl-ACP methyl ester carboxylesterase
LAAYQPISTEVPISELKFIGAGQGDSLVNVVFLHGLNGDAFGSWGGSAEVSDKQPEGFWPQWFLDDGLPIRVFSVDYDASFTDHKSVPLHVVDRAANLLELLSVDPRLRDGDVVFVGYSFGGNVAKEIIHTAFERAWRYADKAALLERVRGVAFLGTPHGGAKGASLVERWLGFIRPSAAVLSLLKSDPNLRKVNTWYRDWASSNEMRHLVIVETQRENILGLVVEIESGDPGLAGAPPVPIDASHTGLCSLKGPEELVYQKLRQFLRQDFAKRAPQFRGPVSLPISDAAIASLGVRGVPETAVLDELAIYAGRDDVQPEDVPNLVGSFARDYSASVNAVREQLASDDVTKSVNVDAEKLLSSGNLPAARALVSKVRSITKNPPDALVRMEAQAIGAQGAAIAVVARARHDVAMARRSETLLQTAIDMLSSRGFHQDAAPFREMLVQKWEE